MLSRGLAGVIGSCLVVNLPGSRGGVKDGLAVLGAGAAARGGADRRQRPLIPVSAGAGWPALLAHGDVALRPLETGDSGRLARGPQPQR